MILWHVLGIDSSNSDWNRFWSGFAGEITLFSGICAFLYAFLRKHNCHKHRCWRLGRFTLDELVLCKKHHPRVPDKVTDEHIKQVMTRGGSY